MLNEQEEEGLVSQGPQAVCCSTPYIREGGGEGERGGGKEREGREREVVEGVSEFTPDPEVQV